MKNRLLSVADWADILLDILESSRKRGDKSHFHRLAIKHFTPIEPYMEDSPLSDALREDKYERCFFTDVTPPDVSDWDLSIMTAPKEEDADKSRFSLLRFRRVPLRHFRGLPVPSSWIGEMAIGFITEEGANITARSFLAWNGKWRRCGNIGLRQSGSPGDFYMGTPTFLHELKQPWKPVESEIGEKANTVLGLAFTRYYEWTVTLGRENGLAIKFVTDPEGAKAVFRLRDIPDGKDRRSALRNWVMEHWRKNRKTEDKDIKVRQHLRGQTLFNWHGLLCEITPAMYDVQRDELLRMRRENEKQAAREWAISRYGNKASSW